MVHGPALCGHRRVRRKAKGPKISGEEVLRAIRYLCCDGYNLTDYHMMRRDRRLYEAARRHFGTWRRAMIAAGINVQYVHLPATPRRFSKPQIIEALQQRQQAGLSLAWAAVCLDNRVLANAAKNGFRSWRLALVAAGLAPEKAPATNKPRTAIRKVRQSQIPIRNTPASGTASGGATTSSTGQNCLSCGPSYWRLRWSCRCCLEGWCANLMR